MYKLTEIDLLIIKYGVGHFWNRMKDKTGLDNELFEIREAVGLNNDEVKDKSVGYSVFMPSKVGRDSITLNYGINASQVVPYEGEKRIQALYLYCNYLGSSFTDVWITSTHRSVEDQVKIMMRDYLPKDSQQLYGYSKIIYDKWMKNITLTEDERFKGAYDELYINVNKQKHVESGPGFPHCNPNICVVDTKTWDSNVDKTIIKMREIGKYITANSLHFQEKGEKANHLILTELRPIS